MGVRTKYKGQAAEPAPVEVHLAVADPVAEAEAKAAAADEATARLKQQIAELEQSLLMQRDPREAKLAHWKAQGMDPATEEFLRSNPVMVDNHELTRHVAEQAAKQHPHGTDEHRELTRQLFNRFMGEAEVRRLAKSNPQPPPQAVNVSHEGHDMPNSEGPTFNRAIHSAPIDRDVSRGGNTPGKVTLTAEERAFAKQIGVSETEYARQKSKMHSEYFPQRGREEQR